MCMCHGQDISHNDNLSQPADTPDTEYERHAGTRLRAPHTRTHTHMHTHTITHDLPLPRSLPFLRLSLLHGVLINKFINGLLIMSAYLLLKHRHCPQTPISAELHTLTTHRTHTHTHTHTHTLKRSHTVCTYLHKTFLTHSIYIAYICLYRLPGTETLSHTHTHTHTPNYLHFSD